MHKLSLCCTEVSRLPKKKMSLWLGRAPKNADQKPSGFVSVNVFGREKKHILLSAQSCSRLVRHSLSYGGSLGEDWRRGWDLNPRYQFPGIAAFEAAAFNHSATSPNSFLIACFLPKKLRKKRAL